MGERKAGFWNRRRVRWTMLAPILAGAGFGVAGFTYQVVVTAEDVRALTPPGRLVDIGGYKLHLDCEGAGHPTVILEAGLGSPSATWTWVKSGTGAYTRVCTYDRAGYGWSDMSPRPRTAGVIAEELHALLDAADEKGPYVLVGHSFGGLAARVFTGRYPAEVAGLVLVDASHPAQCSPACNPACLPLQMVPRTESFYRLTGILAPLGMLRLGDRIGLVPFRSAARGLPAAETDAVVAELSTTRYWRTSAAEFHGLFTSAAEATAAGALGDRPLQVVTAGNTYYSGELEVFTGRIDPRRVTASWLTLQGDLARLSRHSARTLVPQASHVSLITDRANAESVVEAVRRVVNEVRGSQDKGERAS
jgi:pimeloyl-ACP methyl ester carboxylesterase